MPTEKILRMSPLTPPRPPAQLWGLWAITRDRPEGFWWNHIHGSTGQADTPMTFISRDDALARADIDRGWMAEDDVLTVALIGVAPAR